MVLELVGNLRQKYIYTKAHERKHTTHTYTHTHSIEKNTQEGT